MLLRLPEVTDAAAAHPIKVLFVCHYNRHRSATAERLFCKQPDLDVRSAGTSADALVKVNALMLGWADIVFIMDDEQRRTLESEFPGHPVLDHLACLDIPDDFTFLDPQLVQLLTERTAPHLERLRRQRTAK
jgi:predicted protein tyrosine phosphatase